MKYMLLIYGNDEIWSSFSEDDMAVSYTHLRAHETVLDLVCRLLLEKKNDPILHRFWLTPLLVTHQHGPLS